MQITWVVQATRLVNLRQGRTYFLVSLSTRFDALLLRFLQQHNIGLRVLPENA